MKAVEVLKDEHRVIEHGLLVLEAIADRLERGEAVPRERVAALLEFFRDFSDKCHHAKEEGLLFPALEAKGIPREGGPIGVMLEEHEQGRSYQRKLREALGRWEEAQARQTFIEAARGYGALLREHIRKEDGGLFPLAGQALSEADDERLVAGFERHEREHMGEGVHERLHQLLHELEAEFGVGTAAQTAPGSDERVLDVRSVPPPRRHALIFETFESLSPGEAFILVNDHDPKPLYYQFQAEREGQFHWEYLEEGPEVWRVRIGRIRG